MVRKNTSNPAKETLNDINELIKQKKKAVVTTKKQSPIKKKTFKVWVRMELNEFEVKVKAVSQEDAECLVFDNVWKGIIGTKQYAGIRIFGETWKDLAEILERNKVPTK